MGTDVDHLDQRHEARVSEMLVITVPENSSAWRAGLEESALIFLLLIHFLLRTPQLPALTGPHD